MIRAINTNIVSSMYEKLSSANSHHKKYSRECSPSWRVECRSLRFDGIFANNANEYKIRFESFRSKDKKKSTLHRQKFHERDDKKRFSISKRLSTSPRCAGLLRKEIRGFLHAGPRERVTFHRSSRGKANKLIPFFFPQERVTVTLSGDWH